MRATKERWRSDMYQLVLFCWILFCCVNTESVHTEYSANLQQPNEYVLLLDTHSRHRRQSDPLEWNTTSSTDTPSTKRQSTSSPIVSSTTKKPTSQNAKTSTIVSTEKYTHKITTTTTQGRADSPRTKTTPGTKIPTPSSSTIQTTIATSQNQSTVSTTTQKPPTTTTTTKSSTTSTVNKATATTSSSSLATLTESLSEQTLPNTTEPPTYIKQFDNHIYYNGTVLHDSTGSYWEELYNHTKHKELSDNAYLESASINLPFTFPFYGHNITKLQATTGGFLYMSPYVHKFLTFSQYVAPLMANFDTKTEDSQLLYKSYQDRIVFEWRNVNLNDQGHHGQFTFQTKLYSNGTIVFVYKKLPVDVTDISYDNHPVKLGLSDAYYYDYTKNGIRYRRIYKYHVVNIGLELITEETVVIFHPRPTCNLATNCDECVTSIQDFECSWCPGVWRCSDGIDWYRQEWRNTECLTSSGNTTEICKVTTTTTTTTTTTPKPTTTTITTTPIPTTTSQSTKLLASTSTTIPTVPTTTETSTNPATTTTVATTSTTKATTTILKTTTTTHTTTTTTTSEPTTTSTTTTSVPTTTTSASTTTSVPTTTTSTTPTTSATTESMTSKPTSTTQGSPVVQAQSDTRKDKTNSAAIAVPIVLILLVLIVLAGGWIYYAYTHPETASGQWLIEHRPSKLRERFSNLFKWDMQTGEKYLVKDDDISMAESTA